MIFSFVGILIYFKLLKITTGRFKALLLLMCNTIKKLSAPTTQTCTSIKTNRTNNVVGTPAALSSLFYTQQRLCLFYGKGNCRPTNNCKIVFIIKNLFCPPTNFLTLHTNLCTPPTNLCRSHTNLCRSH